MRPSARKGPGAFLHIRCDFYKIDSPMLDLTPISQLALAHGGLSSETKVYRIVDFFSAADLAERGLLRLTRVSDYPDINEGVDPLAKALVTSVVGSCALPWDRMHDSFTTDGQIEQERRRQFVSCWSRTSESHAMWEMYSRDRCSVKLQTTVGKLLQVARDRMLSSWEFLNCDGSELREAVVLAADVFPVTYADLSRLFIRLSRRKQLALRLIKHSGFKDDFSGKGTPRSMQQLQKKWRPVLEARFLKDAAYTYEAEIRLCVRIGKHENFSFVRDALTIIQSLESMDLARRREMDHLTTRIKMSQPLSAADAPKSLEAKVSPDFIEAVCIDPRADEHKAKFIEEFFALKGIKVERSKSFDAAYKNLHAYPHAQPNVTASPVPPVVP